MGAEGTLSFTAVLEQDGDWRIGYVEDLPAAHTQGRSLNERLKNLLEAVQWVLEAKRELARRESEGEHVIRETLSLTGE